MGDQQQQLVVDAEWFQLLQREPQQWQRQQQQPIQSELRLVRIRLTYTQWCRLIKNGKNGV
ncbi:hypothetical protein Q8W38_19650 [Vibrio splendidus]|uniref:Uncharacterized protein n=1 Tax=Vibrio splendidus TaxID=29497 RepID=A0ABD5AEF4_VIBSP|nr:hypothetical protein [Vibrio splendidus]MDP2491568.1 hypothetical protein [Vibrio splendidus]PMO51653.1 hypothetical protein BCT08_22265 [Vibrio splendidus]